MTAASPPRSLYSLALRAAAQIPDVEFRWTCMEQDGSFPRQLLTSIAHEIYETSSNVRRTPPHVNLPHYTDCTNDAIRKMCLLYILYIHALGGDSCCYKPFPLSRKGMQRALAVLPASVLAFTLGNHGGYSSMCCVADPNVLDYNNDLESVLNTHLENASLYRTWWILTFIHGFEYPITKKIHDLITTHFHRKLNDSQYNTDPLSLVTPLISKVYCHKEEAGWGSFRILLENPNINTSVLLGYMRRDPGNPFFLGEKELSYILFRFISMSNEYFGGRPTDILLNVGLYRILLVYYELGARFDIYYNNFIEQYFSSDILINPLIQQISGYTDSLGCITAMRTSRRCKFCSIGVVSDTMSYHVLYECTMGVSGQQGRQTNLNREREIKSLLLRGKSLKAALQYVNGLRRGRRY